MSHVAAVFVSRIKLDAREGKGSRGDPFPGVGRYNRDQARLQQAHGRRVNSVQSCHKFAQPVSCHASPDCQP